MGPKGDRFRHKTRADWLIWVASPFNKQAVAKFLGCYVWQLKVCRRPGLLVPTVL